MNGNRTMRIRLDQQILGDQRRVWHHDRHGILARDLVVEHVHLHGFGPSLIHQKARPTRLVDTGLRRRS